MAFLRKHKEDHCETPELRHETWESLVAEEDNEHYMRDVPPHERSYDRYLDWLSIKGNWGDTVCIYAGQEAFNQLVISNVVYRGEHNWLVDIGWNTDPELPIISKATRTGLHYTVWLPKPRAERGFSINIQGPKARPSFESLVSSSSSNTNSEAKGGSNQTGGLDWIGPSNWEGPANPAGPSNHARATRQSTRTSVTEIHAPSERSARGRGQRTRRKPVRLQNYVNTVDLRRKINLKRYKMRSVPHNHNNLFAAIKIATGDPRSIAQLRRECADTGVTRTFNTLARGVVCPSGQTVHATRPRFEGRGGADSLICTSWLI